MGDAARTEERQREETYLRRRVVEAIDQLECYTDQVD